MASLLKPMLEKLSPALEKRRLMPLKHPALQIGNAAAFTYCLQQEPPLLPLSQARSCTPCSAPTVTWTLLGILKAYESGEVATDWLLPLCLC